MPDFSIPELAFEIHNLVFDGQIPRDERLLEKLRQGGQAIATYFAQCDEDSRKWDESHKVWRQAGRQLRAGRTGAQALEYVARELPPRTPTDPLAELGRTVDPVKSAGIVAVYHDYYLLGEVDAERQEYATIVPMSEGVELVREPSTREIIGRRPRVSRQCLSHAYGALWSAAVDQDRDLTDVLQVVRHFGDLPSRLADGTGRGRCGENLKLGPTGVANLAERFIERVDAWLTRDSRISPIWGLEWPDDHPQVSLLRADSQRRAEAREEILTVGRVLADALDRSGKETVGLIKLLNIASGKKGAAARGPWTDLKPVLQRAVIRLRREDTEDPAARDKPPKQPRKPKRRGRKPDTDPKADKRIAEAWGTGEHKTHADLDAALHLPEGETKRACDRHRKRVNRRGK